MTSRTPVVEQVLEISPVAQAVDDDLPKSALFTVIVPVVHSSSMVLLSHAVACVSFSLGIAQTPLYFELVGSC